MTRHIASRAILILTLTIASGILVADSANGETSERTFAVSTEIFGEDETQALAAHRILFDNGLIYDLPRIDPRVVTLYDPAKQLVTLLDRELQVRSTISTEDLVRITAQARAAASDPARQVQLGLLASVTSSTHLVGYSIQFANARYDISTQKPRAAQDAVDFGRFSDLALRLNLVRRIGLPPFARMTLNDHVTAAGEIPAVTTLTLQRGSQVERFRSTAQLDELSEADRAEIHEVRGMLSLYREVPLKEFPSP